MSKHFLKYKESLELKELGFKDPCMAHYLVTDTRDGTDIIFEMWNDENTEYEPIHKIGAPLYQQAFKWFETKHSMFIDRSIMTNVNEIMSIEYRIKSWKFPPVEVEFDGKYDSFDLDKAQLACVRKLIEILKTK